MHRLRSVSIVVVQHLARPRLRRRHLIGSGGSAAGSTSQNAGDFQRVLHALVEHERQPRRVAGVDPVGDPLQEAGGVLQAVQAQGLLLLRPP